MKSCYLQNMDRLRKYCAKWNKSENGRQMPYDFTYIWNLNKFKILNK